MFNIKIFNRKKFPNYLGSPPPPPPRKTMGSNENTLEIIDQLTNPDNPKHNKFSYQDQLQKSFIAELFSKSEELKIPELKAMREIKSATYSFSGHPNINTIKEIIRLQKYGFQLISNKLLTSFFENNEDMPVGTIGNFFSPYPTIIKDIFREFGRNEVFFPRIDIREKPIFQNQYGQTKLNIVGGCESNIFIIGTGIKFLGENIYNRNVFDIDMCYNNLIYTHLMYSEELGCFLIHKDLCYATDDKGNELDFAFLDNKDLSYETFVENNKKEESGVDGDTEEDDEDEIVPRPEPEETIE